MGTKTDKYLEILSEEGFRPVLDEDGGIVFKYEGIKFLVDAQEDDPEYFRILYIYIWVAQSNEERLKAERVAIEIMNSYKVIKILQWDNGFVATIEMFLPSVDTIRPVLNRILSMLKFIGKEFSNLMNKPEEVDAVIEETLDESIH